MPYVTKVQKMSLGAGGKIEGSGELNYMLTMVIKRYWVNSNKRYQDINDILGALEGSKQEFYRRVVVDYENEKIKENGDVW
jgi:hypothetical protein